MVGYDDLKGILESIREDTEPWSIGCDGCTFYIGERSKLVLRNLKMEDRIWNFRIELIQQMIMENHT
jgi:hypothetical protein